MHTISCLLKRGTPQSEDVHTVHMVCQSDEKGSNEVPISGAEMNLKRKCKLGENSAEMINWTVCNTEQCVHVHVTPENICCIFSIASPDTTPIAVNQ